MGMQNMSLEVIQLRAARDVARQEAQAQKERADHAERLRDAAVHDRDLWERRLRDLEQRIEQAQLALAGR